MKREKVNDKIIRKICLKIEKSAQPKKMEIYDELDSEYKMNEDDEVEGDFSETNNGDEYETFSVMIGGPEKSNDKKHIKLKKIGDMSSNGDVLSKNTH